MKFLSVCSGIEAASVAWKPLGWQASGFSEIEPFPCAVLKHHYPDVPNHGDMTLLPTKIRAGEIEAPDLLCGGTPCQAFSVAGLRQSLDDARGNLTLIFCEIANAIDSKREQPCIVFWENVPGVLNTKDNAFGCFLGALAGEDAALIAPRGRWANAGFVDGPQRAVAWRVLDAQYFGVAQRRRRVFVVASARADFDPAAVLFEFEGVRRDTAPSRKEGEEVAGTIAARFGISRNNHEECVATFDRQSSGEYGTAPVASTMSARDYKGATDLVYSLQGAGSTSKKANGSGWNEEVSFTLNATDVHGVAQPIPFGVGEEPDTAHCLRSGASKADKHESTTYIAQPIPLNTMTMMGRPSDDGRMGSGIGSPGDPCPTITKAHSHAVAQPMFVDTYNAAITGDVSATMTADMASPTHTGPKVMQSMAVRRLTPVECERLQGFPDNYTNIPWRKSVESPDGPRYKALGNSWAVPVIRWIGERIERSLV